MSPMIAIVAMSKPGVWLPFCTARNGPLSKNANPVALLANSPVHAATHSSAPPAMYVCTVTAYVVDGRSRASARLRA